MNRLLLRQPDHKHNRAAIPGRFTLIEPACGLPSETNLGFIFRANILAERPCILRVRRHYDPLNDAYEKYHNSRDRDYLRLAQLDSDLVMEGPELLLYLHDEQKLATYFLASLAGKKALKDYRQSLAQTSSDLMTLAHSVIDFTAKKNEVRGKVWWSPVLTATEFTWNRYKPFATQVQAFLRPACGSPIINSRGHVRKRYLDQRRLSTQIRNMIEQANDGDYLLEGDDFH